MSVVVLVPCFKRPEYTAKCIKALEEAQDYHDVMFYLVDDGSQDGTHEILKESKLPNKYVVENKETEGLRNIIINFFGYARQFDHMVKMDNDCKVPKNWLHTIISHLNDGKADILSPNVIPSNAAFKYGKDDTENLGYRPSKIVGGLWAMRSSLIEDIYFEKFVVRGIRGAFPLLNQIIMEKEPKIGWLTDVTVEDMGHWSGDHPENIKSEEHKAYSAWVGRDVAWG